MRIDRRTAITGGAAAAVLLAVDPLLARSRRPAALRPMAPSDFTDYLSGLEHPEGVAATPDGRLFFSSGAGALGIREADGRVHHLGTAIAPNGVAIDREGRAIIANMGLLKGVSGSLQRVDPATGQVDVLADSLEGRALVASNGPATARDGSIYCTHTGWGPVATIGTTDPAGFIYKIAPDGTASIVARGLRGVNGLCLDREERYVYASLTAEGRIRRWRRRADGSLEDGEPFGPVLGLCIPDQTIGAIRAMPVGEKSKLGYCDGIAFDAGGNLWITLPFANRIVALTPSGALVDIVHDPEGRMIQVPTNLCWGGRDLRDLYVVSRGKGAIVTARTDVPGLPLANWPR